MSKSARLLGWIFARPETMRKKIASPGVIPQIKIKLRNSIVWVPGDLRESRSDYEGEHSDNIMIQLTRGFTDWTIARLMRQAIADLSLVVINILCSHGCGLASWLANVWRWCDVMAHIREHPRSSGSPGAALSPRCVSVLNSLFKPWISMEIGYGHTENKPSHAGMKLKFRKHGWFYEGVRNDFMIVFQNLFCARLNQFMLASVVSGLRFFVAQNSLSCWLFPGRYSRGGYVSLRV